MQNIQLETLRWKITSDSKARNKLNFISHFILPGTIQIVIMHSTMKRSVITSN